MGSCSWLWGMSLSLLQGMEQICHCSLESTAVVTRGDFTHSVPLKKGEIPALSTSLGNTQWFLLPLWDNHSKRHQLFPVLPKGVGFVWSFGHKLMSDNPLSSSGLTRVLVPWSILIWLEISLSLYEYPEDFPSAHIWPQFLQFFFTSNFSCTYFGQRTRGAVGGEVRNTIPALQDKFLALLLNADSFFCSITRGNKGKFCSIILVWKNHS